MQKIKDGVYSVGAVDWNVRSFHGYTTGRGASYNSYLIMDEKITLVDTVKEQFADDLLANIRKLTDPKKIAYIIVNHVEPDHSSALPLIMSACPNAEVIASFPAGGKNIRLHYGDIKVTEVKTGDKLNIGKRMLEFITSPMLHWPDNMVTYSQLDKVLFSNDAFGQHYAASSIFDTDNDLAVLLAEAKKYYANILMPFPAQAHKLAEAVAPLDIDTIATSHGVLWTKHIPDILSAYKDWISGKKQRKGIVVYNTMWHSTERMARTILSAWAEAGLRVRYFDLEHNHISDIMTEVLDAEYIAVGSPTLNNDFMAETAAFLNYMKGLGPKGMKGFAFGSYGWSGQSIGNVEKALRDAQVEIILDAQKVQFVPDSAYLEELYSKVKSSVK